jgi:hypothetical protein
MRQNARGLYCKVAQHFRPSYTGSPCVYIVRVVNIFAKLIRRRWIAEAADKLTYLSSFKPLSRHQ